MLGQGHLVHPVSTSVIYKNKVDLPKEKIHPTRERELLKWPIEPVRLRTGLSFGSLAGPNLKTFTLVMLI